MSLITLEQLDYQYITKYQKVQALKNVNYAFNAGEFYAIMGKSGCGKSTLLKMIAGLGKPTAGKVFYEGKSLEEINLDNYRREEIAVIYQTLNLLPHLNTLENVMYPLMLKGMNLKDAQRYAKETLQSLGINKEFLRKFSNMLSGGEQQRVAIARAVATDARVILADEPTGNLDQENANIVVELFKQLVHEKKCCIIMVTHDNSLIQENTKVIKMVDGMIM